MDPATKSSVSCFQLRSPRTIRLTEMIYIIRDAKYDCNFVYVKTREEAIKICAEMPGVFTWEPLDMFRDEDRM